MDTLAQFRQLWRDLLSEAVNRLSLLSTADEESAGRIALSLLVAVGKCRRWGIDVSDDVLNVLTPQLARASIAELEEFIVRVVADALTLTERQRDAEEGLESIRYAVDLIDCREVIEGCMYAIEYVYFRGHHDEVEIKTLRKYLDGLRPQLEAMDIVLQSQVASLNIVVGTDLLDNYRALLTEEHKEVLPWWLDGTLELSVDSIRNAVFKDIAQNN